MWEWSVLVAVTTWRPCERFRPALPESACGIYRFRAPAADSSDGTPPGDWNTSQLYPGGFDGCNCRLIRGARWPRYSRHREARIGRRLSQERQRVSRRRCEISLCQTLPPHGCHWTDMRAAQSAWALVRLANLPTGRATECATPGSWSFAWEWGTCLCMLQHARAEPEESPVRPPCIERCIFPGSSVPRSSHWRWIQ